MNDYVDWVTNVYDTAVLESLETHVCSQQSNAAVEPVQSWRSDQLTIKRKSKTCIHTNMDTDRE